MGSKNNNGYKAGKERFAINDILYEQPIRGRDEIYLDDLRDPYPAVHYLITFILGVKMRDPDNTYWDENLDIYLWNLRKTGWTTRRVNGLILRIMNKVKLGGESYRCFRNFKK